MGISSIIPVAWRRRGIASQNLATFKIEEFDDETQHNLVKRLIRIVPSDSDGNELFNSEHSVIVVPSDSSGNELFTIDEVSKGVLSVDFEHHEIHEGDHFFVKGVQDVALNNVYDVQFTTPDSAKWTHLVFSLSTESETEYFIYEGATITTPGTAITPINNNRNSSNVSSNTVASISNTSVANANADTGVGSALILEHGIVGSGKDSGTTDRSREIILKQNTIYCMRAIANAAGYVNFLMSWYEHTNPS